MTQEEELVCRIKSEYILLRHFRRVKNDTTEIEVKFNEHLREYKDLTGNDFQLDEIINKFDNGYECD